MVNPTNQPTARLTPAQRFHLEAYGYVLLENVFQRAEVERMKSALYRMREDADLEAKRVYTHKHGSHYQLFGHLVEYDPALLAYAADPRLVPLAEELVGGAVRLEESEAILNRRDPNAVFSEGQRVLPVGFHTGTRAGWGTYDEQNHFHCLFVKTLTYLTDVGPGDGGTAVIPGSHKMTWPQQAMIEAALSDERLIHQIEAPAGSTLLFPESLIHSTTAITTENERAIIVSGYTPTMVREWMGNAISPEFIETLPEALRPLLSGSDNWNWKRHYSA